jgi:hypothetical protein
LQDAVAAGSGRENRWNYMDFPPEGGHESVTEHLHKVPGSELGPLIFLRVVGRSEPAKLEIIVL